MMNRESVRCVIENCFYSGHDNIKADDKTVDLYIDFLKWFNVEVEGEYLRDVRKLKQEIKDFKEPLTVKGVLPLIEKYAQVCCLFEKAVEQLTDELNSLKSK